MGKFSIKLNLKWINTVIIVSIRKSETLYKKFKNDYQNVNLERKYKTNRNLLNEIIKRGKVEYYKFRVELARNDIKKTWNIVRDATRDI